MGGDRLTQNNDVMGTMHIVAATDNRFVMPTGVMMYSVCVNNPDVDIMFHVMVDESVTQQNKDDLKENTEDASRQAKVKFYELSKSVCESLPTPLGLITNTTYFRFFMAELLPEDIDKVLYLDGDLIVRHSLLPLWGNGLGDCAIAAVPESKEATIEWYNRLKYPPALGYFNAGVMLINLKYWRDHQLSQVFMETATKYRKRIKFGDQDILNVVFRDNKQSLPITYNVQRGFLHREMRFDYWKYEKEWKEALIDPVIVHYTIYKPWWPCPMYYPFNSTFFRYQSQTRWKGQTLAPYDSMGYRLKTIVKKILVFFRILKPRKDAFVDVESVD